MARHLFRIILLLASPFFFVSFASAQEGEEDLFLLEEAPAEKPAPVYTSEVELGIGWNSEDSFKFGEFSGLENRGPFLIGNFFIRKRDPYDGDGTRYLTVTGTNLGIDSRFVGVEYGHQGKFKVYLFFDQVPKFFLDDARTPYISNSSGTSLVLPDGWVASDRNISQLTQLNASLQPVLIDHLRSKYGGGFEISLDRHFTLKSEFVHEKKEGSRTIGAIFGSSGGDPAGAVVPEPIDYETDQLDVSLEFKGERAQFVLSYDFSLFRNDNPSLVFQNAFASSRWAPAANFPNGFGQLALPPDNQAHRVTFSGGYIVSPTTRARINLVYNRATQDEAFLPFTINPGLIATTPLPRDSLDGEITSTLASLGLTSRPTSRLTLDLDYRYENRDNDTPRDVFIVVPGDSQNQGTIFDSTARVNVPYDRKQNLVKARVGYRVSNSVKLDLTYSFEQLERTFSEVSKTREHRIEGKVRLSGSEKLSGWIGAAFATRGGTGYIDNAIFLASHSEEFFEQNPDELFENHPLLRKFFIADRDRFQLNGAVNYLANEQLVISLFGHLTQDDYDETVIGLTSNDTYSATFDAAYTPAEEITYHAFFTYESLDYKQSGLSHRSNSEAALNDFAGSGWTADTHDKVRTAGFGFDWTVIKDKLTATFDATYSRANTEIGLTGGTTIVFLPLPNLETSFYAADLHFDYQYRSNFVLRFRYLFQQLNVTDFALDGVNPDTMTFIIGLGNQSPSYSAHVMGFSGIFRF